MAQSNDNNQPSQQDAQSNPHTKPRNAEDGPAKTDKSPEGADPERQIAQEPQQSSGLGWGQS
jgi:hypothetical protein